LIFSVIAIWRNVVVFLLLSDTAILEEVSDFRHRRNGCEFHLGHFKKKTNGIKEFAVSFNWWWVKKF